WRRAGKKLDRVPSSALLDPEVVALPRRERNRLLSVFTKAIGPHARALMFSGAEGPEDLVRELEKIVLKAARANDDWQKAIENFEPSRSGFAMLRRRTEGRHRPPKELAVQTGADSESRTFVMERFRGPGNPFVLVLTNV